jgi:hypothetical protein
MATLQPGNGLIAAAQPAFVRITHRVTLPEKQDSVYWAYRISAIAGVPQLMRVFTCSQGRIPGKTTG